MRIRVFAALLAMTLLAWPARAQEQRGSIEGVVKDASGAVLPGVTVSLEGGAGVKIETVTDGQGLYRFPSLLPGRYTVNATLASFRAGKVPDVDVLLGQVKKVDFSLGLANVAETVQVTAESPIVDVKQSTKATNISGERIDLLPHGRDFSSLITQAPGANQDTKTGAVTIDGASVAENRYVVDGMETTSIFNGLSAKPVLSDFVEEVQVKSSGYPAEFGGSTGAVVNVITKSGTNRFSGNLLTYYEGSRLVGTCRTPSLAPLTTRGAVTGTTISALSDNSPKPCGSNPSLRLKLTNSDAAEYWTFPKDTRDRWEPGGSLGGPIVENKSWFFGAYQPALTRISRTVTPASSGRASAATLSQTQKQQVQYLTANNTMQAGSKLRTRVAFNNSWAKTDGQLPNLSGTDPATTNFARGTTSPNWSVLGLVDYNVSNNFLVGARVGYFRQNSHDFGVPTDTQYVFNTSNVGMADVPSQFQQPVGYSNIQTNSSTKYNILQRKFVQADATWYTHAGGDHQIKGGVQFDLRGNSVNSGNQSNRVLLNWGTQYDPSDPRFALGKFGYYEVVSNGAFPKQGFITQGDVHSNVVGLFVQDTWSVNNKLTLNIGVRTEQEKVPAYTLSNNDYGQYPIYFKFADKVAPRLGAAYDVKGDGRWKVYGSWGMFYDIFKMDLGQESFGGAKWISYYYTLDQADYTSLISNANCPPACAGTFLTKVDYRLPSLNAETCLGVDCVSRSIKPMRSQEATVGIEHQLGPSSAVSFRYVHKQLDRGIEDTGAIDPITDDEPYIIGNPGEGPTATFNIVDNRDVYAGSTGAYKLPKPRRNYDAGEVQYSKRFAKSWSLFASYTLSRLHGNYPGLAEPDEGGRVSPNIGRLFDYPIEQFDGQGRALYGVLPTDRTHQVKGQVIYQFPFGTTLGLNQFVFTGYPISRAARVIPGHAYLLYYEGRNSDGRTPALSQTDLYVQHEFKLGSTGKRLQINATVLNLWDQRTRQDFGNNIRRRGSFINVDEKAFYAGQVDIQSLINATAAPNGKMIIEPRFMQPSDFQAPLAARFGVKFTF